MGKIQVNNNMFYCELSSSHNFNIIGITVSICKVHNFEAIYIYNDVMNIQYSVGKVFGSR